jgi:exonuclease SbcC
MKFHRITVENINSLYGVQEIDFEEDLQGAPLYLIMGPTGSGKTTILDAVCLALFGETPRQPNPQNSLKDIGARVNSYGTGTSKAEVEFSVIEEDPERDGARVRNRYKAGWHFRRAYDNPSGNPQTPMRELLKWNDGEWLTLASSSTVNDYEEEFDAVLGGMEMQDFLRSVMLAQGEFSALLKADAKEKASILERLTDTAVYKKLGQLAKDRWQGERQKLEDLEEEVAAFRDDDGVGPADKLEAKKAEHKDRERIRQGLESWRDTADSYIDWLEKQTELKDDMAEKVEELETAREDKQEHGADFERLERDREVRAFKTSPQRVTGLEAQLEAIGEKIESLEESKASRESDVEEAKETREAKKEAVQEAEQALQDEKPKIKRGQKIAAQLETKRENRDEQLGEVRPAADRARRARSELERTRKKVRQAKDKVRDKIDLETSSPEASWSERLETEIEEAEGDLKELLGDASDATELRSLLKDREHELKDVGSTIDEVETTQSDLDQFAERRSELKEHKETLEETLTGLQEEVEAKREELETKSGRKARLDLELRAVDLREQLEAGEDCPVCGSKDHPKLAHGDGADDVTVIDKDETDLKSRREAVEADMSTLEDEIAELQKKGQNAHQKIGQIEGSLEEATKDADRKEKALEKLEDAWTQRTKGWEIDAEFGDIDAMRQACSRRIEQVDAHWSALEKAETWLNELRGLRDTYDDAIDDLEAAREDYDREIEDCLDKAMKLRRLEADVREKEQELEGLFEEGKTPDEREKELQSDVEEKRKAQEAANEALSEAEKKLGATKAQLKTTREQEEKLSQDYEQKLSSLKEEIAASDAFEDLDAVRAALLEDEKRTELKKRCDEIQERIDDAEKDIKRLKDELEEHGDDCPQGLDPEVYDLDALNEARQSLNEAVNETNQELGALANEISKLRNKLATFHDLNEQLEEQREEFRVWKELKSLIGVRDGDKFKEFAQALNLGEIVRRANDRLDGLSERYKLRTKRDESGMPTLDFEILDDYHAGRARPLSTLSGGETFLVSLALALALADQQQIEMPIETLFLDEGFGTLDRESLQSAMEILNNLQGEGGEGGRTVGVISHVEALQEQIADQVIVETQQDGRSEIRVSPAGS